MTPATEPEEGLGRKECNSYRNLAEHIIYVNRMQNKDLDSLDIELSALMFLSST